MNAEHGRPGDIPQRVSVLKNSLRTITDAMDDLTLDIDRDNSVESEFGVAIPLESIPGSEAFVTFLQEPFQRALSIYTAMRSPELAEEPIFFPRVSVVDDATAQYTCGENLIARNPFFNGIFISASKMQDALSEIKFGNDLTKLKADIEGHATSYLWRVNLGEQWINPNTIQFGNIIRVYPEAAPFYREGDNRAELYNTEGFQFVAEAASMKELKEMGQHDPTPNPRLPEEIQSELVDSIVSHLYNEVTWDIGYRGRDPAYIAGVEKTAEMFIRHRAGQLKNERYRDQVNSYFWHAPAIIELTPASWMALQKKYAKDPEIGNIDRVRLPVYTYYACDDHNQQVVNAVVTLQLDQLPSLHNVPTHLNILSLLTIMDPNFLSAVERRVLHEQIGLKALYKQQPTRNHKVTALLDKLEKAYDQPTEQAKNEALKKLEKEAALEAADALFRLRSSRTS